MPKRKLTPEEGRDIVWGEAENYEEVESEVIDMSRWSVHYVGVFKDLRDGSFWETCWSKGATEYQYEQPFEYEDVAEFYQVEPKEVTVVKYMKVEE
jgi:hypothetical protein